MKHLLVLLAVFISTIGYAAATPLAQEAFLPFVGGEKLDKKTVSGPYAYADAIAHNSDHFKDDFGNYFSHMQWLIKWKTFLNDKKPQELVLDAKSLKKISHYVKDSQRLTDKLYYFTVGSMDIMRYQSDGAVDYWQSPAESISRRTGDCEDMAILKFYGLKDLGVKPESLMVVVVRTTRGLHATLAVKTADGIYVLNNEEVYNPGNNFIEPLVGFSEDRYFVFE